MFRTKINARDVGILCALLLCAVLLLWGPWRKETVGERVVIITPEESTEMPLAVDRTWQISGNGITLTVEILDGKVRVAESDCPDRICVSGGWISAAGESLICAPAGVRITVEGGNADVDFIAG